MRRIDLHAQRSDLRTRKHAVQHSLTAVVVALGALSQVLFARLGRERDELEAFAELVERRLTRPQLGHQQHPRSRRAAHVGALTRIDDGRDRAAGAPRSRETGDTFSRQDEVCPRDELAIRGFDLSTARRALRRRQRTHVRFPASRVYVRTRAPTSPALSRFAGASRASVRRNAFSGLQTDRPAPFLRRKYPQLVPAGLQLDHFRGQTIAIDATLFTQRFWCVVHLHRGLTSAGTA